MSISIWKVKSDTPLYITNLSKLYNEQLLHFISYLKKIIAMIKLVKLCFRIASPPGQEYLIYRFPQK